MSDKDTIMRRERPAQNQAFLAYAQLPETSVKKLWGTWGEIRGLSEYVRPSFKTLERWRSKYQWVERAKQIHNKAKDIAVRKTVEELVLAKEEVLAITRVVMIRYGQQLKDNAQGRLTILDFERAWRIQRIELGLPAEIGKQEVDMDAYASMSGEKLVKELESFTERYKERLKERKVSTVKSQVVESFDHHVVI